MINTKARLLPSSGRLIAKQSDAIKLVWYHSNQSIEADESNH
jgi:hypothetical protein